TCLEGKRSHLAVIQLRIERKISHSAHSIRLYALAFEIAGILDLEIRRDQRVRTKVIANASRVEQRAERDILSPRDLEDSYGMNEGCAPGVCKNVSSVGRCDAGRFGELKRRILLSESFSDHFLLGVSEDAKTHSDRPQTPDRIVLTNGQAELGPRCEKPIRFVHSARNQVVDQNSDIGSLSTENEWLLSLDCKRSIQSCHQPLTGGLFVAGRTIYLAGEVKTRNRSDLEGSVELCRRIVVVLDS